MVFIDIFTKQRKVFHLKHTYVDKQAVIFYQFFTYLIGEKKDRIQ